MKSLLNFKQKAERKINLFEKKIINLIKQGKRDEVQMLLTRYTRDFCRSNHAKMG